MKGERTRKMGERGKGGELRPTRNKSLAAPHWAREIMGGKCGKYLEQ